MYIKLAHRWVEFLFRGGRCGDVPHKATGLHRAALRRLKAKLDNALAEFNTLERTVNIDGALERLAGPSDAAKFPDLRADDVDYLLEAGLVDPLPHVPVKVTELLASPGLLFPAGVAQAGSRRVDREANKGDRVTLTLRLLRSGKLSVAQTAVAFADTFLGGRSGGSRLQEVWNGAVITDAAVASAKPEHQACPASLATLDASDDRPVWLSTRDGNVFFDQPAAPVGLRCCLARSLVSIVDLMTPPPCESGAVSADGLSRSELGALIIDGPLVDSCVDVVPITNAFPMGLGWSSYAAQAVQVDACLTSGFTCNQLLSAERVLASQDLPVVAIATDDVNLFQRMSALERDKLRDCDAPL